MKCYQNRVGDVDTILAAASDCEFTAKCGRVDPRTMMAHADGLRELAARLKGSDAVRLVGP